MWRLVGNHLKGFLQQKQIQNHQRLQNVFFYVLIFFIKIFLATLYKIDEIKKTQMANFGRYAANCLPKFVQQVQVYFTFKIFKSFVFKVLLEKNSLNVFRSIILS